MEKIRVLTAGDSALLIQFEQRIGEDVNRRISATVKLLKMQQIEGIVDRTFPSIVTVSTGLKRSLLLVRIFTK